jgi:ribosomal protein L37E
MDYTITMEEDINEENNIKEPVCPRCGLRSYDSVCQACGTPIVDKKDDEEEDYDWREKHR